jgi:hypothetical protein
MSIDAVVARIGELNSLFTPPAAAATAETATPATTTTATAAGADTSSSSGSFASLMGAASGAVGTTALPTSGTSAGQAILQAAQQQVGQAEQPPGSNDSPRIAQYRQATAGSGVGPWCAYFTSWAARQAGVPLGDQGQGFGAVSQVWNWAQQSGKAYQPGTQTPQPGDLIVWGDRHIGIVENVDANGSIHTIEGNSSDQVSRRTYGSDGGGATGFVRLG